MRIYFLSFHLMTDYELKNINPDDNGDLLGKVERLFDIKFGDTELKHISTFEKKAIP
ncbi:MAG TPA: hypothetical protein PK110_11070 [Niabella sp.]|nr:hypothetical protein [Chitinophagaceae bacterium]HRO85354.1 hypothetical protein [Niabella sp.]HUN02716.1 hypothetical protein [Niabella sp.]